MTGENLWAYFKIKMETLNKKSTEELLRELDESLAAIELNPKYGYAKSRCPDCGIYVYPFEHRQTPEGRTLPSSKRRLINVGGENVAVYDPICPQCGRTLPAVICGGKEDYSGE